MQATQEEVLVVGTVRDIGIVMAGGKYVNESSAQIINLAKMI